MAIPKADRELEALTSEVLAPGERLVAATRALAVGAFEGRLGIFGELLTEVIASRHRQPADAQLNPQRNQRAHLRLAGGADLGLGSFFP